MGQALYRKYRSRSFSEVIGQEHITKTLSNALKSGAISHAYLFTGPRGVGKTSVARILAHKVNGLSYSPNSTHLDIIEIDAASNRRIDEVRDLRDKVHISPAAARYKVYIIDEAHMLTREAFNALLKTLEEPPEHCIFILATTEAHKLPETIISRTQRFTFKPIDKASAVKHLSSIAKQEGIDIDAQALELLAEHGDGSFRDSLGMLDQISSLDRHITKEDVRKLLGIPPANFILELLGAIEKGSTKDTLNTIMGLREFGVAPAMVAQHLSALLRRKFIEGKSVESWVPSLLKQLIEVPASSNPDEYLEVSLLEAAAAKQGPFETAAAKPNSSEAVHANPPKSIVSKAVKTSPKVIVNDKSIDSVPPSGAEFWPIAVELMKERAASLYTALKLAHPIIEGSKLTLVFEFGLHQNKLKQSRNINVLQSILEELTGRKFEVECLLDKQLFKTMEADKKVDGAVEFQAINNIFGPAEVLES